MKRKRARKGKKAGKAYVPARHAYMAAAGDWEDCEPGTIEAIGAQGPFDLEDDGSFSDPNQVGRDEGVLVRVTGALSPDRYIALAGIARHLAEIQPARVGIVYQTPGGATIAMEDAAEALAALPHVAFAQRASSAGYLLASRARRITADPHAIVGSLGVLRMIQDTSRAFAQQGVRVELVTDGSPLKGTNLAGVPQTDEMKIFSKAQVKRAKRQFLESIAAARGVTFDQINAAAGEGGEYTALEALDRNLIDGIETLAAFERRILGTPQENSTMPQPNPTAQPSPTAQAGASGASPPDTPPDPGQATTTTSAPAATPVTFSLPAPTRPQGAPDTAALLQAMADLTALVQAQAKSLDELQNQIAADRRDQELAQSAAVFQARVERLNLSPATREAIAGSIATSLAGGGDPEAMVAALEEQAGSFAHQLSAGVLGQSMVVEHRAESGDVLEFDLTPYSEPAEGGSAYLSPTARAQGIFIEEQLRNAGDDPKKRLETYRRLYARGGGTNGFRRVAQ